MSWFTNLALRSKLLLGFGVILASLVVVTTIGYVGMNSMRESQRALYQEQFANAVDIKEIRSSQNAIRVATMAMILLSQRSDQEALVQDIRRRSKHNTEVIGRLVDRNRNDPKFSSRLEEFSAIRAAYRETREAQIIPLVTGGNLEEAKKLVLGTQNERGTKMQSIADDLVAETEQRAQAGLTQSESIAREAVVAFALAGIIALVVGGVLAAFLSRVIGKVSHEIREGANVLASSASEIVATTTQVASGAAETAAAVNETTSTVEEVKKTAEVSSDKARYVSDTAQKAAQVSQSGKRAVEQSVEGINRIRGQMEAIADSIMKLSEQSQAIGEIIATVNDLAEQSNILAINAAIEAARAGEQGKGFAVVAQEVKNLAEQSKQATAQVRSILGDIQKATSGAVLAAEQGSKAVEAGVAQSMEAGEAIRTLSQSIAEAAQAATQIAASSQQQQVGMDQVAVAMENIKQASTQNVAGTKQAETAAHSLNELGQKLKQLVEVYRL